MAAEFDISPPWDALAPLRGSAPVIVYVDIKSPYAFIAKDPTRALQTELGFAFEWRPLTLDIPSYLGSARLDNTGKVAESERTPTQWQRVRYAYRDARRYARLQGYTLRGTEKIWDTTLVHIGMQWAACYDRALDPTGPQQALARYLDAVYEPFWRRALDVEDADVIAAILAQVQIPTSGFGDYATGKGLEFHQESQRAIFEAGIFGVPTYVVAGQWFFGREHLSTVGWLCSRAVAKSAQASDRAPDLAYDRLRGRGPGVPSP